MSPWQSLDSKLPYALKEHAASVAKQVWREIGHTPVAQLDGWWYRARLSYIPPSKAGAPPRALIINCIEGDADQPVQSAAYTVDVLRWRVKAADGTYAPVPHACAAALDALEAWVGEMPTREKNNYYEGGGLDPMGGDDGF
jgi:hypothetical protein